MPAGPGRYRRGNVRRQGTARPRRRHRPRPAHFRPLVKLTLEPPPVLRHPHPRGGWPSRIPPRSGRRPHRPGRLARAASLCATRHRGASRSARPGPPGHAPSPRGTPPRSATHRTTRKRRCRSPCPRALLRRGPAKPSGPCRNGYARGSRPSVTAAAPCRPRNAAHVRPARAPRRRRRRAHRGPRPPYRRDTAGWTGQDDVRNGPHDDVGRQPARTPRLHRRFSESARAAQDGDLAEAQHRRRWASVSSPPPSAPAVDGSRGMAGKEVPRARGSSVDIANGGAVW